MVKPHPAERIYRVLQHVGAPEGLPEQGLVRRTTVLPTDQGPLVKSKEIFEDSITDHTARIGLVPTSSGRISKYRNVFALRAGESPLEIETKQNLYKNLRTMERALNQVRKHVAATGADMSTVHIIPGFDWNVRVEEKTSIEVPADALNHVVNHGKYSPYTHLIAEIARSGKMDGKTIRNAFERCAEQLEEGAKSQHPAVNAHIAAGANEALNLMLAGWAAKRALGKGANVPEDLKPYVEALAEQMKQMNRETLQKLARWGI